VPEGAHENPPGIAKRRHEQIKPHPLAADRNPRLAEIDLQLMARRRLEAQRRPRFRPQRLAQPLTARSTVRRLTASPFSRAKSWRTTSALPRCRRNRSRRGVDDVERTERVVKGIAGKRLTYRTPGIGEAEAL